MTTAAGIPNGGHQTFGLNQGLVHVHNTQSILKYLKNGQAYDTNVDEEVLPEEAYKRIDTEAIQAFARSNIGLQLLPRSPLAHYGVTTVEWKELGDMEAADVNMTGEFAGDDGLTTTPKSLIVPVYGKAITYGERDLAAYQADGFLNTAEVGAVAQKVAERVDKAVFKGITNLGINGMWQAAGQTITGAANGHADWDNLGGGGDPYETFRIVKKMLRKEGFTGPMVAVLNLEDMALLEQRIDSAKETTYKELVQRNYVSQLYETPSLDQGEMLVFTPGGQVAEWMSAFGTLQRSEHVSKNRLEIVVRHSGVPRFRRPKGIVKVALATT